MATSKPDAFTTDPPLQPGDPCPVCGRKLVLMVGAPVGDDSRIGSRLYVWLFCIGTPPCVFMCGYDGKPSRS